MIKICENSKGESIQLKMIGHKGSDNNDDISTNNDFVVILNNFINCYKLKTDDKLTILFENPCFHIRNSWNVSKSPICQNYYHDVLFFSESENFDNIIKCVKSHIITVLNNLENSVKNYKKIFSNDFHIDPNISFDLPICFNPDKMLVENINLSTN